MATATITPDQTAVIAEIFIAEKPYSTAPKSLTLKAFTITRARVNPRIQIHPEIEGNQKRM